ncbi:hypothetical protein G9A89_022845 [Geosiphon pyriformis]|nr:hypothetical protein G9A89_022845 [Geosiphon pyriformis]
MDIGVQVVGHLSFTIIELQTVALALKYMFSFCSVMIHTMAVWHPDLHMLSGSMSKAFAGLHTYFIKTVYKRLSVAVRKRLYNRHYPGVLCLHCGEVEFSDHVFMCCKESGFYKMILFERIFCWKSLTGSCLSIFSVVVESLLLCLSDVGLYALLCKDFVLAE